MKKLTALLIGLTTSFCVAQQISQSSDFSEYSASQINKTPLLYTSFKAKKKADTIVFYQDWKDFYENKLFPIYLQVKEPIKFNNPAYRIYFRDVDRIGFSINLDEAYWSRKEKKQEEIKQLTR